MHGVASLPGSQQNCKPLGSQCSHLGQGHEFHSCVEFLAAESWPVAGDVLPDLEERRVLGQARSQEELHCLASAQDAITIGIRKLKPLIIQPVDMEGKK